MHRQSVKASLDVGETEFSGHLMQRLLFRAEYVFMPHSLQTDSAVAPVASEYFPLAHGMHKPDPVASLKVPATHATQAPPSGPV